MLIWVWTRNDQSGILDGEFRDGDIDHAKPDSFEPSIGSQEKLSWLIVKVPDPPNMMAFINALEIPEYAPGPELDDGPPVRRRRVYRLPWRNKLSAAEVAIKEAATSNLPEGATSGGGTVVNGVVSGLFSVSDFVRK